MSILASSLLHKCPLHRSHKPKNLTVEFHHLIPVAWELATPLAGPPPFPGRDRDGRGMLWDSRGMWICPTSHRNTHWWITQLMHALADAQTTDPAVAYKAIRPRRAPQELIIAYQALTRFAAFSHLAVKPTTLLTLTAEGEWGEA